MAISAKTTLVVIALALAVPTQALGAEIRQQPADTVRAGHATMEWAGGDASPKVFVERRHGLDWVTEAREDADNLSLAHDDDADVWSASWLPSRYTPAVTYRIRVEGTDYVLVSDEFDVHPCECVLPGPVHSRWREGAFRLRLTAEYVDAPVPGFLSLPARVTTGRPVVRVFRDGRRIGSVRLRYASGAFRGKWASRRGPRHSFVFRLVSLTDGFGNS
jgi:hypothetical protein